MSMIEVHVTGDSTALVAIISGATGIIGVILGGALAYGSDWLTRKRSEDKARKYAARLLIEQLVWCTVTIDRCLEHGTEDEWEDPAETLAVWNEHKAAIGELDLEEWTLLVKLMRHLKSWSDAELAPSDNALKRLQETANASVTMLRKHVE